MIKEKTGERVEKKTLVCNSCITLMTQADYTEHNGECQLCRGGASDEYTLFYIGFDTDGDSDHDFRVYNTNDREEAVRRFTEEWNTEYDFDDDYEPFGEIYAQTLTQVSGHEIKIL